MANDPLDLWPSDIQLNPLTPFNILRLQAAKLTERTQGLLVGEVVSEVTSPESDWEAPSGKLVIHRFEIVVPQLKNARYQLFSCSHDAENVYPVYFEQDDVYDIDITEGEAASQNEFIEVVRKLLATKRHRALLTSLLARIAEANTTATPA